MTFECDENLSSNFTTLVMDFFIRGHELWTLDLGHRQHDGEKNLGPKMIIISVTNCSDSIENPDRFQCQHQLVLTEQAAQCSRTERNMIVRSSVSSIDRSIDLAGFLLCHPHLLVCNFFELTNPGGLQRRRSVLIGYSGRTSRRIFMSVRLL